MPKQGPFDIAMKTAVDGAKQATDKIANMTGVQRDRDLANYSQLAPEDFNELMSTFGEDKTLEYIRVMETKLQKQ